MTETDPIAAVQRLLELAGMPADARVFAALRASPDLSAALPALVAAIDDEEPDPIAMDQCGRSFHTLGDYAAGVFLHAGTFPVLADAAPLLVPLLAHPRYSLRTRAARALSSLGRPTRLAAMAHFSHPSGDTRLAVLQAVSTALDDPEMVAFNVRALADPDFRVRARAADNLSHTPAARSALLLLENDPESMARNAVRSAIARIDERLTQPG